MQSWNLLSIITFFPLLGAFFILLSPQQEKEISERNSKSLALWTSIITFLISLFLLFGFDSNQSSFQFLERIVIANGLMTYQMGVDGISILFVMLTTFLMPFCILASWNSIKERVQSFMIAFLVLETLIIGTFCALDIILFYLFFESVLIPMFIIIGVWGGERKVYSAFKFFLYTLLGSVLMLAAMIFLYVETGSTELIVISENLNLKNSSQYILWLAFFSSFAVKLPMWPVHTWLPDAHVEAPTSGSVILAAILLKMGGYGFLRFSLPLFPEASHYFAPFMFTLSIIAIIYTSLVAYVQEDIKKLIAYSSVARMGFVTLGIFTFNSQGIEGSIYQMLSHGLISAALFFCVGMIYDRLHTRKIKDYGGLVSIMPNFAIFFMIFTMANVALPGTSGFVGEFLTVIAAFSVSKVAAIFAATGVILSAVYGLFLYKRVVFGTITNETIELLNDLSTREKIILFPLAFLIILFGLYPSPILNLISVSSDSLVSLLEVGSLDNLTLGIKQ
jgi:NADH-quinone oxidoreductase subunit M